MATFIFSITDAKEIDKYDDAILSAGAFKQTLSTTDDAGAMTVDLSDSGYEKFKRKYMLEVGDYVNDLGGSWKTLYTYLKDHNYTPKTVDKPDDTEIDAAAKARAEAAAKEKAAAEARSRVAEEEKRRAAAAEAEAQAERLRAEAAAAATVEQEAPLQFSEAQNVTKYMLLAYGPEAMDSIPAEWFDAFVDGNAELSAMLEPFNDTLYDRYTDHSEVSLARINEFLGLNPNSNADNEPIAFWNLWEQGANLMQSLVNSGEQAMLTTMAGGPEQLQAAQTAIEAIVIPHFVWDTSYHVFEFTAQRGTGTPQTYTVSSFVDPEGGIDIQMARVSVSEGNTTFFLTPEHIADLNASIAQSPDKEIIQHGLKLARDLLEDGSAAEAAFDAQIKLDNE